MNPNRVRTPAGGLLLLALAACNDFSYPGTFGGDAPGGGIGDSGNEAAVLPEACTAGLYELDGSVWRVTGAAKSLLIGCSWPIGQTRPLCEEEWVFEALPPTNDLYRVHHGTVGSFFLARLCGEQLYLDGNVGLHLEQYGCDTGSPGHGGVFVAEETPPLAWLQVLDDAPATGDAVTAEGLALVWVYPGCEWELDLSLVRVDAAALVHGRETPGRVLLSAPQARAAALARSELGLLLRSDGPWTWLPMRLLVAEEEFELELPPGPWSLSITPRPGRGRDARPTAREVPFEVRSGERTRLAW